MNGPRHGGGGGGTPSSAGTPDKRYHGMDFIRAAMMMLGVVLHTALVFMPEGWLYMDPQSSPFAPLIVGLIHIFRMPVFFVMAGFFGAMLYQRRGIGHFSLHRFDRIVVPLAIGWFVLYPLLMWSVSFAWTYSAREPGPGAITEALRSTSLAVDFAEAGPMHLWFLYYLVYYYLFFAGLTWLLHRLAPPVVGASRRCVAAFATGRLRWLRLPLLVLLTAPAMLCMAEPGIDTPFGFAPVWRILALYAVYFGVGWLVYAQREVVSRLEHLAWLRLAFACLLLGLAIILTAYHHHSTTNWKAGAPILDYPTLFTAIQLVQVTGVWLLVLALTGVCERLFRRPARPVRYLVDASYWIYLLHLPLTIFIPSLFRNWEIDGTLKMLVMMVLVTIPLLVTYHVLVRGTAIGSVLNGRRFPVWPFDGGRSDRSAPLE